MNWVDFLKYRGVFILDLYGGGGFYFLSIGHGVWGTLGLSLTKMWSVVGD
jgi:hypothetical protein